MKEIVFYDGEVLLEHYVLNQEMNELMMAKDYQQNDTEKRVFGELALEVLAVDYT